MIVNLRMVWNVLSKSKFSNTGVFSWVSVYGTYYSVITFNNLIQDREEMYLRDRQT